MKIKQAIEQDADIDVTQILDNWDAELKDMLEEMWGEDDEVIKEISDVLDNEREEDGLIKKFLAEFDEEDIFKEFLDEF